MNTPWKQLLVMAPLAFLGCGASPDEDAGDTEDMEEAASMIASEPVSIIAPSLVNAAAFKEVAAQGTTYGTLSRVTDTVFAPAGTYWQDLNYAVVVPNGSSLRVDLGEVYPVSQLVVQADCNDTYRVDASSDGAAWQYVYELPRSQCPGLRTRPAVTFSMPIQARYLRIYATSGDGLNSVSELQAFVLGEACNGNVCSGDSFCCNPSCGICAPKGGGCTKQFCDNPQ